MTLQKRGDHGSNIYIYFIFEAVFSCWQEVFLWLASGRLYVTTKQCKGKILMPFKSINLDSGATSVPVV